MQYIMNKIRKFARDEGGTAVIETVVIFPMLVWAVVAMAVFFDAYRIRSVNLKAAYTISDMLSRENPIVDSNYINGLKTMYDFLVASKSPTWIRVTMVQFETNDPNDPNDDQYIFKWSKASGGSVPDLNQTTLSEVEPDIPIMGDGDSVIIVETHMRYQPAFDVGLKPYDLDNVIVTRPRFAPPCWETCING